MSEDRGLGQHLVNMARRHAAPPSPSAPPGSMITHAGSFNGSFSRSYWLSAAWSPDGSQLAYGGRTEGGAGTLQVWDGHTGHHERHGARGLTHGVTGAVIALAWSPDGERLATLETSHTVGQPTLRSRVQSRAGDARTIELPPEYAVTEVAWSPDGALLALSGRHCPYVVFADPASGAVHGVLAGLSRPVAWDPARRRIAGAAGMSIALGEPAADGRPRELATLAHHPTALAWARHGRYLAVAQGEDILVLDAESGAVLRNLPWSLDEGARGDDGTVTSIEWLDGGGYLLELRPAGGAGYDELGPDASIISLWDVATGTLLSAEVFSEARHKAAKPVVAARLAPDRRRIALAIDEAAPVIWQITGGLPHYMG